MPVKPPITNNPTSNAISATPAIAKPAVKKTTAFKQLVKGIKQKLRNGNTGLIILVIIGALVAAALVAFMAGILAWGGASGFVVALMAIIGLGVVGWGTIRIINNISRRGLSMLKAHFNKKALFTKAKRRTPYPSSDAQNVSKPF